MVYDDLNFGVHGLRWCIIFKKILIQSVIKNYKKLKIKITHLFIHFYNKK